MAKSQLLYMGCPLTKECKHKKNPIFIFKTVRVRLRESIRLWECVNTESHWDCKTGILKAVRKWSCPLARVSTVSEELTVFHIYVLHLPSGLA